jgi:cytochrome c peroxidase
MLQNGGQLGEVEGVEFVDGDPVGGTGTPLKSDFTEDGATGVPIFSSESCGTCHKSGGIADVEEAHMGVLPPDTGGH